MDAAPLNRESLQAFADCRREGFEWELRNLVEMPTVSSDPRRRDDMWRCAEYARDMFFRYGFEGEILETSGHPIVAGTLGRDPSLPTVTVYNHLDVQPADEPQWSTDPFRMVIDGDTFRGRGTTDDKGPAITAFYGAIAAKEAGVPLNIRFLWEMEEEIGSPSFRQALERHRSRLGTDLVLVSDTIWVTRGRPSTPAGLRGLLTFSLVLETADHDLHSGVVGGAARNPLSELMKVVSELMDGETGRVKVPGFYKDVIKPSKDELEGWLQSGFSIETFKRDHALRSMRTEDPLKVMKRLWSRPTLEVHGVVGGYTGPGVKTAVPARAEVKLSCRLAPGMDPQRTFERLQAFVHRNFPGVDLRFGHGTMPFLGHVTGPHAEAVKEAYRFAFGVPCAFTREGGSIGAVTDMEEVLGAPVHFLGLSLPSHGYHAPNENYDWEQAGGGMAMFAHFFEHAGRLAGKETAPADAVM
jgi:acetylornithine deacetylase/succinyl-diaminopimelate desuccinylase-like protein